MEYIHTSTLRSAVDKAKIKLESKRAERARVLSEINDAESTIADGMMARNAVQIAAGNIQKKLEYRINNIVSMALAAVFPDPYEFELRFVARHNRTEADLLFTKNGNTTDDILNAGGGGPADVASFALRLAFWSIGRTQAVQILDEPTRNVSRQFQPKVSLLIKELSDKLSIQFIVISHVQELYEQADRVFQVTNVNGESVVEVLE